MKIRPIAAWYDMWVGAYWDKARRRLYVLPVPCLGAVIDFAKADVHHAERDVERLKQRIEADIGNLRDAKKRLWSLRADDDNEDQHDG